MRKSRLSKEKQDRHTLEQKNTVCYVNVVNKLVHHNRFTRLLIFLIPLFLVFMGIKVPDLSRPHKPKPMRRAILDKTPSRALVESTKKVDVDPAIPLQSATAALPVLEFPLEAETGYFPAPQLSTIPLPARAPPA